MKDRPRKRERETYRVGEGDRKERGGAERLRN